MEQDDINEKWFDSLYPMKVWLATTVLLVLILIIIQEIYKDAGFLFNIDKVITLLLSIVFAIFISVPALVLTYLTFSILVLNNRSEMLIRFLCAVIAVLSAFLILRLFIGIAASNLTLIYLPCIVMASMFFKVKQSTAAPTTPAGNKRGEI